ncbi:MAG: orotidine-5'-phosphate decarboxylase [endosymbiont of Galathealinum brachiosum]|uniref:Orotidine 5'-phosphate decarboxylase n=1 Tax=endosymbiont of Galathealinum brachiosum TaxID=2200906 RepID=A0A370DIC3_9GAMM|nr:MAG: orotidine-5'-phosphate decarboxylase [endosymbiont of Galathealinum brachiosum]
MSDSKIIVALDYPSESEAFQLIDKLDADLCRLKVGKEMFTHLGPDFVEKIQTRGFDVFLDLKYHDIPNTVAKACEAAASLGVWMLNVHASGGSRMMEAAANAVANHQNKPYLIAVTILTSMSQQDLSELGINVTPAEQALKLAGLAQSSGLDGIVCSAQEAPVMRQHFKDDFLLVSPGIRPAGSKADDQRRIMTPVDALKAGSNYLVIGRPITQSDDPLGVLRTINSEIS